MRDAIELHGMKPSEAEKTTQVIRAGRVDACEPVEVLCRRFPDFRVTSHYGLELRLEARQCRIGLCEDARQ